ncbi:MAG: acyl-CoA thioesterase [Ignavibacteria bacterium]
MEMQFDVSKFPVQLQIQVRSYEVDFQNVVNNAVYFNYFELARIDYRKKMGYKLNPNGTFSDGLLFFVAHNECDYFAPAYLENELIIYTRIDYIKNSSLNFEHLIFNKSTDQFIAHGNGVIVNVDPITLNPVSIPDTMIEEIKAFDKEVKILR